MKYTENFAEIVKENGVPNLNTYQFKRFMNIIHLEGDLKRFRAFKESLKDTNQYHKYDLGIFKVQKKLTELTGNISPELLIIEMLRQSKIN